jgi:hypothetical protein
MENMLIKKAATIVAKHSMFDADCASNVQQVYAVITAYAQKHRITIDVKNIDCTVRWACAPIFNK